MIEAGMRYIELLSHTLIVYYLFINLQRHSEIA